MSKTTLSFIFAAVFSIFIQAPALAQFDLQITEVNPYGTDLNDIDPVANPDAIEFIEITNVGTTTFTAADGDLHYDDQDPDPDKADILYDVPSAGIAPGESVIFLNIDYDPETNTTGNFTPTTGAAFFLNQFPAYTGPIRYFDGSGMSSGGADGASLFLTQPGVDPTLGNIISTLAYAAGTQVAGQTFQADANGGQPAFAVPTPGSVNGAAAPVMLGDVNLDGVVDFLDIAPFIEVLSSNGFQAEADIDLNLTVDFLDITPFINLLSGQ